MRLTLFCIFIPYLAFSYVWRSFTPSNSAFPTAYPTSIVIDSLGNRWVGSTSGLIKFHDTLCTAFNRLNSPIPSNNVYSVAIDSNSAVWISMTDGGVASFNNSTWTLYNTGNSNLPSDNIRKLLIDKNNNVIVATMDAGLAVFNNKNKWTIYNKYNSLILDDDIYSIVLDTSSNTYWIGTVYGLCSFNGAEWQRYSNLNSPLKGDLITALAFDKTGALWIATEYPECIAKFDNGSWSVFDTPSVPLPGYSIRSILPTYDNDVWFGTEMGNLLSYSNQHWQIVNTPAPAFGIFDFAFDKKDSSIWIAGYDVGLLNISGDRSTHIIGGVPGSAITSGALVVWPNPCNTTIDLSFLHSTVQPISIRLYNEAGALITDFSHSLPTNPFNDRLSLNISKIPKGLYLIKVQFNNNSICASKLIKY